MQNLVLSLLIKILDLVRYLVFIKSMRSFICQSIASQNYN